jgi:hypothetical protein
MLQASDSQARRAAKRVGLLARKSRKRRVTIDNFGGFALIHPHYNCIVAGERFDMSADDVVEFCEN